MDVTSSDVSGLKLCRKNTKSETSPKSIDSVLHRADDPSLTSQIETCNTHPKMDQCKPLQANQKLKVLELNSRQNLGHHQLTNKVSRKKVSRRKFQKKLECHELKAEPFLEDEDDMAFNPSIIMLKSILEDVGDSRIIWEVVKSKILPDFHLWQILMEKSSLNSGCDISNQTLTDNKKDLNLKNTKKFLKIIDEIDLILSEFKFLFDNCLQIGCPDDHQLEIRLRPNVAKAINKSPDSTYIITEHLFNHDFQNRSDVSVSECNVQNFASKGETKLERSIVEQRDSDKESESETLSHCGDEAPGSVDGENKVGQFNEKSNTKEHNVMEGALNRCRKPKNEFAELVPSKKKKFLEGFERPSDRPFRKNPENKRYYCTIPGCSAGESKNWTCSSGVWKHFLAEHSDAADKGYCVFPCDTCERRYPTKALLNQHQKENHITHFEFVCTVCAKRLPTNQALLMHMRMHTGEKPFACDQCNYRSIRQAAVNQHKMRMHDNENEPTSRKHVCDKCGKTFKERSKLKEHIKTHSEARTFLCGFCGKGLKNRQSLNRHLFTHGMKNECSECGKNFSTQITLNIHQRDKHGMTI